MWMNMRQTSDDAPCKPGAHMAQTVEERAKDQHLTARAIRPRAPLVCLLTIIIFKTVYVHLKPTFDKALTLHKQRTAIASTSAE